MTQMQANIPYMDDLGYDYHPWVACCGQEDLPVFAPPQLRNLEKARRWGSPSAEHAT